ncbi:MAG: hypothetical protein KKB90_01155 [Actinobacteria bacterium]|nr:hypothetical protein [Actinomycetota bacterium]MBU4217556.1 hypothetical protein [Actinomycetota bacterium]MBU4360125.1 hypothetical protein [Actinomycetota bacterium]MBU4393320.1 hypothetical protein [Actinomycetota bacterium]MBU4402517.1 hypothetical protein [Actinomycetota bacterium]
MEETSISEFKMKGMRFQYWFTVFAAIPLGVAIILFPEFTRNLFNWKEQDRLIFGISGSVYLAFGTLSLLGLKDPVKWSPILLLQFVYKVTWFMAVVGLMAKRGELELSSASYLIIGYAAMVAGDLWAVPWGYLLKSRAESGAGLKASR